MKDLSDLEPYSGRALEVLGDASLGVHWVLLSIGWEILLSPLTFPGLGVPLYRVGRRILTL